jgi:hypothetical protein
VERMTEPDTVERVLRRLASRAGILEQRAHAFAEWLAEGIEPGLILDEFEVGLRHDASSDQASREMRAAPCA